ncbi:MAG: pyridoxal phosphate-dependent aminotransferase [Bacillota bacterium]
MFSEDMYLLGSKRSVIRDLFEFGAKRKQEIGAENVYDFSLGNPNVPAPDCVNEAITEIFSTMPATAIHSYTSAQGALPTREAIANNINERFSTKLTANNIYVTVGAAASLMITLRALNEGQDEFITFAPFFPEYTVFVEATGGSLKVIPVKDNNFQLDIAAFEKAITAKTKAVILNSPNNPSGVIYSEESIIALCKILNKKSAEFGAPIYLISDEPYREIAYDNAFVPYLMNYYKNTIVCYSYSKSLSLPGERIGYIAVNNEAEDSDNLYLALCGAGRALGYVCAPSLMQLVIQKCINAQTDLTYYKNNRDTLYNALTKMGYTAVHPDGAFYLFVKSPELDANAFSKRAQNHELLIVPGDSFGVPGYVRISYCVAYETIVNSLPAFEALIKTY